MEKIKVGIVGCGFVAQKRHVPSFLRLKKDATVVALCDLNQSLAQSVAQRFGIPKAYCSVSEMLAKEKLDVIDICTPPQTHASVAIQSIEGGCQVLMEKPMALTVSDCDKMIKASRQYGKKLSIVHNQKFYPSFTKAQSLVENGYIGNLSGMTITLLTHREDYLVHENHWIHRLPGGIIGETGPHVVYLSLAFVKNVRQVEVFARKNTNYPWVLYDDYRIELEGENISSSIYVSHSNNYTKEEVELLGTDYALQVDMQSMLVTRYKKERLTPASVALSSLSIAGQTIRGVFSNALRITTRRSMLGHDIMIGKFVKSIKDNQPVPVTPEEGRESVRVMEVIVKKLDQKRESKAG